MEIRSDGYKSSAWLDVGHHHFMKHNLKSDCHMKDFLQLLVTFRLILKLVSLFTVRLLLVIYSLFELTGNNIIIVCHFVGRGKSKKEAKRLAAHQMWQRLQDMPADSQDDVADEVNIYIFAVYII